MNSRSSTHSSLALVRSQPVWWLGALAILAWAWSGAWFNPSQLNDSWEQLVWAQSFEWGYWKHPPLTTWLMASLQRYWGPSALWPYLLGGVCAVITLYGVYRLALILLPIESVNWVVLLFTLNNGFTRRAQVFNHNSVLVALMALLAWRLAVALISGRTKDWIWVGLLAGFGLITKYQALMPIAFLGLMVVLVWAAPNPKPLPTAWAGRPSPHALEKLHPSWLGLGLALGTALMCLAPHGWWLWQNEGLPMKYVEKSLQGQQGGVWSEALSLYVLQFRNWIPGLLLLGVHSLVWRWTQGPSQSRVVWSHPWWWTLIWGPALALLALASFGVSLQSHWGMQALQFLVLPLAVWAASRWGQPKLWVWWLWAVIHIGGLVLMASEMTGTIRAEHADVRKVQARHVVVNAVDHWQKTTPCPLIRVEAPSHLGGMMLAYFQPVTPWAMIQVSEDGDPLKSPWAEPSDLARTGVLRLSMGESPATQEDWQLIWSPVQNWPAFKVWAQVVLPTLGCGVNAQ
ncbi:MAG: hypothetical protein RL307_725 [Pseudomonadota bacterium]